MKAAKFGASLLVGASVLAMMPASEAQVASAASQSDTAPTQGQTAATSAAPTPTGTANSATASANAPEATDSQAADVIVTGSRILTNGNASPTPVTVVSVQDALRVQPGTVADALNTLPVFEGSRNQVANPGGGTSAVNGGGNASANNLNLRGLGPTRNLILFDSHRVPPTGVNGQVDVDMIPQQLLQRVDVVTGGVSAVYGSDAITGVVNFITDRTFNGVKANAQFGITEMGDDMSYNFGLAAGTRLFGDRAHFEASYEYRDDRGVARRSSRGYNNYSVQGLGTAAVPYNFVTGARNSTLTFGGLVACGTASITCSVNGQTFDQNGVLSPFVHGDSTGVTGTEIGGDGIYYDLSLKSPLESHQAFGRFDYDFTDTVHLYVEGAYNSKYNDSFTGWPTITRLTFSSQNAFLAQAYRTALAAAGPTFTLSKAFMDAQRTEIQVQSDQLFFNAGLNGDFGGGYKWDVGYVHSNAKFTQTNPTNFNNGRLYAALDAVSNGGAQPVCNATLSGLYPGCVALNPFGPTAYDEAALDYTQGTTRYVGHTKIDDVTGSITGSPFDTWAGPFGVAFSAEYRKTSFYGTSDALPTDLLNCAGLRYNCTATSTVWQSTVAPRSTVSQSVKEAAVEVDVPLLKDSKIARALNINGAARYTDYDTSGNYWTWKVGLDWQLNDALRFRGTRSRDIRAPTLDDLYAPTTINTTGTFSDLLTNSNPVVTSITSGNPNLTAEIGNTLTGGVVYKPQWLSGLSVAVDYYDISITNAVLNLLASNATLQRACYTSGGSSPFCQLQVRPGGFTNTAKTNVPTTVYNTVINVAKITTHGVDFELNYGTRMFTRPAAIRIFTSWQPAYKQFQPGLVTLDYAGVAYGTNGIQATPKWRVTGFLRVSPLDSLDLDFQARWRSSLKYSADPTLVQGGANFAAAAFVNMNVAYQLKNIPGKPQLFLNVSNLFDKAATPASFYGGQGSPGQFYGFIIGDDVLGRAYTVGLRARF